jgi:hypothetical protein
MVCKDARHAKLAPSAALRRARRPAVAGGSRRRPGSCLAERDGAPGGPVVGSLASTDAMPQVSVTPEKSGPRAGQPVGGTPRAARPPAVRRRRADRRQGAPVVPRATVWGCRPAAAAPGGRPPPSGWCRPQGGRPDVARAAGRTPLLGAGFRRRARAAPARARRLSAGRLRPRPAAPAERAGRAAERRARRAVECPRLGWRTGPGRSVAFGARPAKSCVLARSWGTSCASTVGTGVGAGGGRATRVAPGHRSREGMEAPGGERPAAREPRAPRGNGTGSSGEPT